MSSSKRGRIGAMARASLVLGVTGALAGSFLVAASGTAWAAGSNWFVNPTTGADSNACTTAAQPCKTITHALALSTDGDTITLAGGTYTGALTVTKAVTIQGAGQGVSIIDAAETTPSASSASAMLVSLPTADTNTLTVTGVTIRQGGISKFGGGIELVTGRMVVNNSTITNNEAGGITGSAGGGGIGVLGTALGTSQQLTLNSDTISHNKTVAFGSTNYNGGGLYTAGPTTISNTVISANSTGGTTLAEGSSWPKRWPPTQRPSVPPIPRSPATPPQSVAGSPTTAAVS